MAGIGAFVASTPEIIDYYATIAFRKSMPNHYLCLWLSVHWKRFELLQNKPELRNKLWEITRALQND
jgi:glycine C-acetyltransferase